MKKVYVKPEIVFEDFSLCASIAAGCELDTPLPSYEENCGYPIGGDRSPYTVFVSESTCTHPEPEGFYNGFCYHAPYDYNNVFNS